MQRTCDFLVIGSGLSGLVFALKAADKGKVIILSKSEPTQTNTAMAQGGIAAVMASDDSFISHINDTLTAGAGLCNKKVVEAVVEQAPDRIADLVDWGVQFEIPLTREGGHSHRRILHIQDHTGQEIHQVLLAKAQKHPNISFEAEQFAIDLILNHELEPNEYAPVRCLGAHVFDRKNKSMVDYFARFTMLATGGAGKVYLYTSNWSGATGDGIAMAYRAGARVANLEFMQFHPTCLYHPSARNFLITEALRGEGAELVNAQGQAFMSQYHALGSLAPRDIVARSMDAEMKKTGAECVFLDITHKPESFIRERFPLIYERCMQYGIDMTKEPIPVVPAAHYLCGGVLAHLDGRTDIPGLLAVGESACTGLHGANRLASNSLLECLVTGHKSAEYVAANMSSFPIPTPRQSAAVQAEEYNEEEMILIAHMWDEIRRLMWNYVGIVRSNRRLMRAKKRMQNILSEIRDYYGVWNVHPDIIELRNIALVAMLTIECALQRKESRGIHFTIDYPEVLQGPEAAKDTVISASQFAD